MGECGTPALIRHTHAQIYLAEVEGGLQEPTALQKFPNRTTE